MLRTFLLRRAAVCSAALGLLACGVGAMPARAAQPAPAGGAVHLVISGHPGQLAAVEHAVARAHGRVTRTLPLIDGVAADVPADRAADLAGAAGVRGVTRDERGRLMSYNSTLGYDPDTDTGGLNAIAQIVDVQRAWKAGYTGKGVDVALIDSGVAPVQGLTTGNILNGPDLSFDSQNPNGTLYADEFGHGTHMASLIAGRDAARTKGSDYVTDSGSGFVGVAPDARVINLKVAGADGGTDVSQVIAAINWVTQHAHDPGLNIRVLSLSYGTRSTQSYTLDPLAYAAEQAWRKGVFVVVAGGNDGVTDTSSLADPAMDPYVMAVGADDPNGTVNPGDDFVPTFATHGTNTRHVDLIAPAVHVLGLRVPGSYVDANNPNAAVGTRFIRGSGTSQATAIVAGAAAVVLQKFPSMTPDLLKADLMQGAVGISAGASATYRGSGLIDVAKALNAGGSNGNQPGAASTGTGSLEAARGGSHVANSSTGAELTGEYDAFGNAWNAGTWATAVANNTSWVGGAWNGSPITGSDWSGTSWTGNSWSSQHWTASLWDGTSWSSHSWTSHYWTSTGWNSHYWTDSSWASQHWTASSWSSGGWQ